MQTFTLKKAWRQDAKEGCKRCTQASDFARNKTNSEKKIMTKLCPRGKAAAKEIQGISVSIRERIR